MSRKCQNVVIKSQAREMISKVYDFMKKEASNNYAEKITDARWRTAQAVGVSESTVTRILRERRAHEMKQSTIPAMESNTATDAEVDIDSENEVSTSHSNLVITSAGIFTSPMKKRRVGPRKINLNEFDIDVVRKTIQNYRHEYHQYPTLSRLKNVLRERIKFDGSITTLRRLLHKLGYKWRKTENNRKVLTGESGVKIKNNVISQ